MTGKVVEIPSHHVVNEKLHLDSDDIDKISPASKEAPAVEVSSDDDSAIVHGKSDADHIIVTGHDAATHLLPLRDDSDSALTFRSLFLATILSAFQAVMTQIYNASRSSPARSSLLTVKQFKPTLVTISGTFIVLIAYFLGKAWAKFLPRGDRLEARWRAKGNNGDLPRWINIISFFNYGPWGLKEHSICAITATAASNASVTSTVFAAQELFYGVPLKAGTVVLSIISIGLFGYGICGVLRPIAVWHVDAVYWSTLPTVKTLQGLHWQDVKNSKPLRYFWYAYIGMFFYEFLPAYIWPWLNSVSIPCLASMKATGSTAAVLTNLFGGATNNEGLGLFSLSFDWQYITSFQTALPLKMQAHQAVGLFACFLAMICIYYSNAWDAKSQPFMSTRLRSADGGAYPISKVFVNGVLDENALAKYGVPRLTGTFVWAMVMANAAVSSSSSAKMTMSDSNRSALSSLTASSSGARISRTLTRAPELAGMMTVIMHTWSSTTKRLRGGGTSLFWSSALSLAWWSCSRKT